jgi:hypothetical protein
MKYLNRVLSDYVGIRGFIENFIGDGPNDIQQQQSRNTYEWKQDMTGVGKKLYGWSIVYYI